MRRLLFLILVCLILVPLSRTPASAKKSQQLHSIQANFTQETHLKILVKPIVSHGFFAFQAPDSLRWEYRDPFHSIMLMQDGKMEKIIEKNGRFEHDNSMSAGSMQVILPQIGNWLDGRFTDSSFFTAIQIDEHTIILTPKEEGMRSIISSIKLHLGKQHGVMESVTIFEGQDASTTLTFDHIVLNRSIPKSFFSKQ